ncbi:MAG TPA: hypothetical protein VFC23_08995 [Thermoanaerobaculia bacterium]|nr:hypothetical protein [Thermoanaerobaculia bacterium]
MTDVPEIRVRPCNEGEVRPDGRYVLYWMTACRRLGWSFALERAAGWARRLGRPLVILESLRCGYRWASDRHHRFVLDGMAGHAARLAGSDVLYYPYVEPAAGAGKGLVEALAREACVVVADDAPVFFLPRLLAAAAPRLAVRLEAVDSNGLLPLRAADRELTAAYHFRRFLQKVLPEHLAHFPEEDPLAAPLPPRLPGLPQEIARRWPAADPAWLHGGSLAALPIDHDVPPVPGVTGGDEAAGRVLARFLDERLPRYGEGRNDPGDDVTSGLSPYLHFGHVSIHQAFAALAKRERWSPERLVRTASGAREGWWGMSPAAAPGGGAHPQLPADAVGEEGAGMVGLAAGGAGDPGRAEQPLGPGRPRPELVQRHLLVFRPLRPAVGAGAAGVRLRALHEQREHAPQISGGRLRGALRPAGADVAALSASRKDCDESDRLPFESSPRNPLSNRPRIPAAQAPGPRSAWVRFSSRPPPGEGRSCAAGQKVALCSAHWPRL